MTKKSPPPKQGVGSRWSKSQSRKTRSLGPSFDFQLSTFDFAFELVNQLAGQFDRLAPRSHAEAEEELRDAGFDPRQIGERLEQRAHAMLARVRSTTGHDAGAPTSLAAHPGSRKEPPMNTDTAYDPFRRGPFPVGVRTLQAVDHDRDDRPLPVEIWYPAAETYAGQDVARASCDRYELLPGMPALAQQAVRDAALRPDVYPLILFSHGSFAHRRQSTFLCTHLASHGYVVAAVDHTGNTASETAEAVLLAEPGRETREATAERIAAMIAARVPDIRFLLDRLLDGLADDAAACIDRQRVGITGHSFGGWTALAAAAVDVRIGATVALAPGGSSNPRPGTLPLPSPFTGHRDVPTLFLVADRDTAVPLSAMYEVFARAPRRKQMVILRNADHFHFCDYAEQAHEWFRTMPHPGEGAWISAAMPRIEELCPAEHAYVFVRGLGLAHMDAFLKEHSTAARFLGGDIAAVLAARGVAVQQVDKHAEMTETAPQP
jgi:predicted dienelactone hydrolase